MPAITPPDTMIPESELSQMPPDKESDVDKVALLPMHKLSAPIIVNGFGNVSVKMGSQAESEPHSLETI